MIKKILIGFILFFILLLVVYCLGPKPNDITINPTISIDQLTIDQVEEYVATKEAAIHTRKGNEAKIIWADSSMKRTKYAMVYLHGFSASHEEGNPLHKELAKKYNCNLYLSRLAHHGIESSTPFKDFDGNKLIESAKEAIAIGQVLGEEVIVIGCSTGGTLATYLAAHNPEIIDALMLYAPNIDVADPKAFLLSMPWGLQLGRAILNSENHSWEAVEEQFPYWYTTYRIEGLVGLKHVIDNTMTEANFKRIKQPIFVSYYYRDEANKDDVISISRIKDFLNQVSTPEHKKDVFICSDCDDHVITSDIVCKNMEAVIEESTEFLDAFFEQELQ